MCLSGAWAVTGRPLPWRGGTRLLSLLCVPVLVLALGLWSLGLLLVEDGLGKGCSRRKDDGRKGTSVAGWKEWAP